MSERSEFGLIGNGHAETALQNGCGPDQMSGGDAELGADEERRYQCRDRSGKLSFGVQKTQASVQGAPGSSRKFEGSEVGVLKSSCSSIIP